MKKWIAVLLVCILAFGSVNVLALDTHESIEPISYCALVTVVVQAIDGNQPVPAEGHYAVNYMTRAQELGLIGEVPESEWEQLIETREKELILARARGYLAQSNVTYDELRAVVNSRIIRKVVLNGEVLPIKLSHRNGQIMLPLRAVAEGLGYDVAWNAEMQAAVVSDDKVETVLTIGQNNYSYINLKDGGVIQPMELAWAPTLINGTTYVPVQFFNFIASYSISNQILTLYEKD